MIELKNEMMVNFSYDTCVKEFTGTVYWQRGSYRIHSNEHIKSLIWIYSDREGFEYSYSLNSLLLNKVKRVNDFYPVEGDVLTNKHGAEIFKVEKIEGNLIFVSFYSQGGQVYCYTREELKNRGYSIQGLEEANKRRITREEAEKELNAKIVD